MILIDMAMYWLFVYDRFVVIFNKYHVFEIALSVSLSLSVDSQFM